VTTQTLVQGTKSGALVTCGALAAGTFIAGAGIDLGAKTPLNVSFELEATPASAPSGNKQAVLYLQWSLDGTNYSTGPTSGTTTTNELDLNWAGSLPLNDASLHRKQFYVVPLGRWVKPVVKNDCGAAFTSGFVYRADWTGDSV
jgi:hypothetical protein